MVKITVLQLDMTVLVAVGLPGVDVLVGVPTRVGVLVSVTTEVGVVVFASVFVGAGVEELLTVTTNWGASAPNSREARLMAVEPGVETPKLNVPSPVTKAVTSNVTQVPLTTAGEVAKVLPMAGALS